MATAAELSVIINADTRGAETGIKSLGGKITGLGGQLTKLGTPAIAGFGAIAAGSIKAIGAASDMAETQSKLNAVFGETGPAADTISAALEGTAQRMLMTRQEAGEAIGTYGNLLTAMGHSEEAAADMSTNMVQLAADLASFNNMDPTEVLGKLRAGLVGEAEPLKTLGVNLNVARIEAEAMSLGLLKAGEKLSSVDAEMQAQIKSAAAYSIILKDTATAQGDVERTGDGFANSMKQIKASIGEAWIMLGEKVLPATEPLVDQFSDALPGAIDSFVASVGPLITEFADKLPGALETARGVLSKVFGIMQEHGGTIAKIGAAFMAVSAAAAVVGPPLMAIGMLISGLAPVIGVLGTVLGVVAAVISGPVLLAVGAAVAAFVLWKTKGDEIKDALGKVADKIGEAWEALKNLTVAAWAAITEAVETAWAAITSSVTAALDAIKSAIRLGWDAMLREIRDKLNAILGSVTESWDAVSDAISDALDSIGSAIRDAWAAFLTIIGTAVSNIVTTVADGFRRARDTVNDMLAAARRFVQEHMDAILAIVAGVLLGPLGLVFVFHDSFNKAVAAAMAQLSDLASRAWRFLTGDFIGSLTTALSDVARKVVDGAKAIGEAIVDGIKQGIADVWGSVTGWVKDRIGDLIGGIKDAVGMGSPATEFIPIGEAMAEGIAVGFARGLDRFRRELPSIINPMIVDIHRAIEGAGGFRLLKPGDMEMLPPGGGGGLGMPDMGGLAARRGQSASAFRTGRGGFMFYAGRQNYWREYVRRWGVPDRRSAEKTANALGIPIPAWLKEMMGAREGGITGASGGASFGGGGGGTGQIGYGPPGPAVGGGRSLGGATPVYATINVNLDGQTIETLFAKATGQAARGMTLVGEGG